MSEEARTEHFQGVVDAQGGNEHHAFLQAAQIVAGEARRASGRFTFSGYATDPEAPILETAGRYVRDGNLIRVFFDSLPEHPKEIPLPRFL